jgi:hypothetical protein
MCNDDHMTVLGLFKALGRHLSPLEFSSDSWKEMEIIFAFVSMLWWNSRSPE